MIADLFPALLMKSRELTALSRQPEPDDLFDRFPEKATESEAVDISDDVLLGSESDEGIDEDIVLEDKECGYCVDVESDGDGLVVISVEFGHTDPSSEIVGKFLDDRSHPPAGSAPGCPAVDDGDLVTLHEGVKVGFVEFSNHLAHWGHVCPSGIKKVRHSVRSF